MKIENLCISCMREKNDPEEICPFCGYERNREKESTCALTPFTVLSGKYLVGKVTDEQIDTITYTGMDMNLEIKVVIKEYYPRGCVQRDSRVNTYVRISSTDSEDIVEKGKKKFLNDARSLVLQRNSAQGDNIKDCFEENNTAYVILKSVNEQSSKSNYMNERMYSPVSETSSASGETSRRTASPSGTYSYQVSETKEKKSSGGNKMPLIIGLAAVIVLAGGIVTYEQTKKNKDDTKAVVGAELITERKEDVEKAAKADAEKKSDKNAAGNNLKSDSGLDPIQEVTSEPTITPTPTKEPTPTPTKEPTPTPTKKPKPTPTSAQAAEPEPEPAVQPEYITYFVVNCKQSITLRPQPDVSSGEICQIPLGSAVSYVSSAENGFYKVIYNGNTGYALASYLSTEKQAVQAEPPVSYTVPSYETYYVVNCNVSITLRPQPDVSSGEICQIPLGSAVSYVSSAQNGFYKVIYNGNTGYALASYLSKNRQYTSAPQYTSAYYDTYYVVNCKQSITLRTQPSTSAGEICQIPLGSAVSYISSAENGFYYICYNGNYGYSLASYLSPSYGSAVYDTCRVVNCNVSITLRDYPDTSAGEICQIPLGATVSYVSNVGNGFYEIYYMGQHGYSLASYLAFQ